MTFARRSRSCTDTLSHWCRIEELVQVEQNHHATLEQTDHALQVAPLIARQICGGGLSSALIDIEHIGDTVDHSPDKMLLRLTFVDRT